MINNKIIDAGKVMTRGLCDHCKKVFCKKRVWLKDKKQKEGVDVSRARVLPNATAAAATPLIQSLKKVFVKNVFGRSVIRDKT